MRVIFINRFYWPETPATGQLLADLAEGLASLGHEVAVIASAGTRAASVRETRRGVHIWRVRSTRWARGGVAGKAIDFGTFYLRALVALWRMADSSTTVVAMTDPPLLGIGVALAARLRRARLVHWIHDIYPEIAAAVAGQRWPAVFRPFRDAAWRKAERCAVVGRDMAGVVAAAGVPPENIAVIPNWAPRGVTSGTHECDRGSTALRTEWELAGKFVVAYSGNLGRVHDLEPVLGLAHALRDSTDIAFVIVGDGAQRDALAARAVHRGLRNVRFFPPQPRERLRETLAAGDVHLVTLREGCERFVFPSKLYGAVAAGRPVIYIGPGNCELSRMVVAHDFGFSGSRDDLGEVAEFIRRLARNRETWNRHAAAAVAFASEHDVSRAVAQWAGLLESVSGARPAPAVAEGRSS